MQCNAHPRTTRDNCSDRGPRSTRRTYIEHSRLSSVDHSLLIASIDRSARLSLQAYTRAFLDVTLISLLGTSRIICIVFVGDGQNTQTCVGLYFRTLIGLLIYLRIGLIVRKRYIESMCTVYTVVMFYWGLCPARKERLF